MRRRLPPVVASGGLVDFRPFARAPLFLYTVASFLCFLGLWTGMSTMIPARERLNEQLSLSAHVYRRQRRQVWRVGGVRLLLGIHCQCFRRHR